MKEGFYKKGEDFPNRKTILSLCPSTSEFHLGEYKRLPPKIQEDIILDIRSKKGTISPADLNKRLIALIQHAHEMDKLDPGLSDIISEWPNVYDKRLSKELHRFARESLVGEGNTSVEDSPTESSDLSYQKQPGEQDLKLDQELKKQAKIAENDFTASENEEKYFAKKKRQEDLKKRKLD